MVRETTEVCGCCPPGLLLIWQLRVRPSLRVQSRQCGLVAAASAAARSARGVHTVPARAKPHRPAAGEPRTPASCNPSPSGVSVLLLKKLTPPGPRVTIRDVPLDSTPGGTIEIAANGMPATRLRKAHRRVNAARSRTCKSAGTADRSAEASRGTASSAPSASPAAPHRKALS